MSARDTHSNGEENEKEPDETAHLMSTEANRIAVDESIPLIEAGMGIKVALEDLWE